MPVPRGNLGSLNFHSFKFRDLTRPSLDPISDSRGGLLSCSQVDKTEIRRRMTLQIQAETLGRADQERRRSGGKQSTGARICPERRNKSRRGVLDPYLVKQLSCRLAGYYSRPEAASIPHQT